jgi:nucleolar protein 6
MGDKSKKERKSEKFKLKKTGRTEEEQAAIDEKKIPVLKSPVEVNVEEKPDEKPANKRKASKELTQDKGSKRFILFIGNLPYSTTADELQAHFKDCNFSLYLIQVKFLQSGL